MSLRNKINIITIILAFVGIPNLSAQTWEEREEERQTESNGFWSWLFDEISIPTWDESVEVKHPPADIVLKINFARKWKFSIGDNEKWATPGFDDNLWEKIKVPSDWENDGFNGYDGYAWYRIHFDGKDLNPTHGHFLVLGTVDDVDEAFINGKLIGQSGQFPPRFRTAYNHDRKYAIPTENINFDGDNVIAVRVYDQILNGGIVSGRPGIYATPAPPPLLQDLNGEWKFTKENQSTYSQMNCDDQRWSDILVPAFWDNQGYRSLDGIAWYRKHFNICFDPESTQNLYLLLGKIDDFDITYLNGVEIGRTDDAKGYGESKSYQQIRLYKIPKDLLKAGDDNVIAIKVYDIGNEGGIYKGPIGIIAEEDATKMIRN